MNNQTFDTASRDVQAMPVTPIEPRDFDIARYEDFAAAADQRYAEFLQGDEGIAVWQRVRVAEVFADGCRDMENSLRLQLGGLNKTLDYKTDAPTYLEPWYGIGTTASAFGGEYEWPEGQAPAVRPLYPSVDAVPDLTPRHHAEVPIMRHTLRMIEYFLEQTQGRIPMSWSDIQAPINVATELVDTSGFFMGLADNPARVREILEALTDVVISFTQVQTELIGDVLARPGHGFASSRAGTGIGMSEDNMVMISPRAYSRFCVDDNARIGEHFGGTAVHSCGDWGKWIKAVLKIPNLIMVDGAFSPQTDPAHNQPETFRDALAHTGVILHTRLVGDPDDVLVRVKRLWAPGLKLIVTTYVQDPQAQHQLYQDIHSLCS